MAHKVASELVSALCDKLAKNGSRSDQKVPDLDRVIVNLKSSLEPLAEILKSTLESYAKSQQKPAIGNTRTTALERLLVSQFEQMFFPDEKTGKVYLSRRILPGLFRAFEMMSGEETLSKYRAMAREIADELADLYGDSFSWTLFYNNDEARCLLIEILLELIQVFENPTARIKWLATIINSVDEKSQAPANRTAKNWHVTEQDCLKVMQYMFEPLRKISLDGHSFDKIAQPEKICRYIDRLYAVV